MSLEGFVVSSRGECEEDWKSEDIAFHGPHQHRMSASVPSRKDSFASE